MLTGSMAMNYYAQPRMTRDIDIVVELERTPVDVFAASFALDYYVPLEAAADAIAHRGMFNLLHLESVVKVDLIVRKGHPYRLAEFDRRVRVDFGGFATWLVRKEDLILSKLAWAHESESELQKRDVVNLLSTGADLGYLRKWAPALGVGELLDQCLNERHAP